jgi:hypothetical protein
LGNLIAEKSTAPEGQLITPDSFLTDWIKETEQECSALSRDFDKEHFQVASLDNFFIKTVQQHDDTRT